jgi:hypothetical protein
MVLYVPVATHGHSPSNRKCSINKAYLSRETFGVVYLDDDDLLDQAHESRGGSSPLRLSSDERRHVHCLSPVPSEAIFVRLLVTVIFVILGQCPCVATESYNIMITYK